MTELLFSLYILIFFSLVGYPFARHFSDNATKYSWLIIPSCGLAITVLCSTIFFRFGLSLHSAFILLNIFSIFSLIYLLYSNFRLKMSFDYKLLLLILSMFVLLFIPALMNGLQFNVFQGNHWDTFGYLSSGLVYSKSTFETMTNFVSVESYNNLFRTGVANIYVRPSAHMLYALVVQILPQYFYKLHYIFLITAMLMTAFTIAFMVTNIFKVSIMRGLVISLFFIFGFYGQYALDINSWSQIISYQVLIVSIVLVILSLSAGTNIRLSMLIGIFLSASLYIYPESTTFHAPAFLALLCFPIFLILIKKIKRNEINYTPVFFGVLICVIMSLFFFKATVGLIVSQFKVTLEVDWWQYFHSYIYGRDGLNDNVVLNIFDGLSNVFGFYFITPKAFYPLVLIILIRVLLLLCIFGIIYYSVQYFYLKARQNVKAWLFLVFVGVLTLETFTLFILKNYWGAGKALSYISPYLVTLFFIWIIDINKTDKKIKKILAVFLIVYTVGLGLYRPIAIAQNRDGIHYGGPYPSSQLDLLKRKNDWRIDYFHKEITKECKHIKLAISEPLFETFLSIMLLSNDKTITKEPGAGDCLLSLKEYDNGVSRLNIQHF